MAANNSTSFTVETSCGPVHLRKRGRFWYARKQHEGHRQEFPLKTADINTAIDRAHSLLPEIVLGAKHFQQDGRSVVGAAHYFQTFKAAKKRAAAKGMEFSLTDDDIENLIKSAQGRCALTGTPFSMVRRDDSYRAPFAPSLDRIDSSLGYTASNTRLVCVAVNWALSDWGAEVFETIATGYVATLLREIPLRKNRTK